ncbi:MAG: hypothetical protein Q9181_004609 [Wetmoreana brouardii]
MATTTLVTFLLQLPQSVQTVDLLGSWDNFQEAYPLQKDRRAGPGHWRGCHNFKKIICDGYHLDPSVSRDGGLKMGGTYWYFYRLNDVYEHHDPIEPSTTACPLLPGQRLNVLEVPVQLQAGDSRHDTSRQFSDSAVFTLDPKAKYISPKSSVRRIQNPDPLTLPSLASSHSYPDLGRQRASAATHSVPCTADPELLHTSRPRASQGLCLPLPRASSLMTVFHRMRGTRSAPTASQAHVHPNPNVPRPIWPKVGGFGNQAREVQQSATTHIPHSQYMAAGGTSERPLAASQLSGVAPRTVETLAQRTVTSRNSTSQSAEGSPHPMAEQLDAHDRSSLKGSIQVTSLLFRDSEKKSCPKPAESFLEQQIFSSQPSAIASEAASVDTVVRNENDKAQTNPQQPRGVEEDIYTAYKPASPHLLPIQSNS